MRIKYPIRSLIIELIMERCADIFWNHCVPILLLTVASAVFLYFTLLVHNSFHLPTRLLRYWFVNLISDYLIPLRLVETRPSHKNENSFVLFCSLTSKRIEIRKFRLNFHNLHKNFDRKQLLSRTNKTFDFSALMGFWKFLGRLRHVLTMSDWAEIWRS